MIEGEETCSHCMRVVAPDLGVENSRGDVLCGPCYFALWGSRTKARSHPEIEALRPDTRRPAPGRPIWVSHPK